MNALEKHDSIQSTVFPCWERAVNHILNYWHSKCEEYDYNLIHIQRSTSQKELKKWVNLFMARMTMVFDIGYALLHGYMWKQYLLDQHCKFATNKMTLGDGDLPSTRSLCSKDGIWFLIKSGKLVYRVVIRAICLGLV